MNNDHIYVELHLALKQQTVTRTPKRFDQEQECWLAFCVDLCDLRNDTETTLEWQKRHQTAWKGKSHASLQDLARQP